MEITITKDSDFFKTFPTDDACIHYLEHKRWNGKPRCVHCGHDEKIYYLKTTKFHKCSKCSKQFRVTHGTIFHSLKIDLKEWFYAIYLFIKSKNGISAGQLAKDIGVKHKTALKILKNIREAVKYENESIQFSGVVECDELYIGGKSSRDTRLKKKMREYRDQNKCEIPHMKAIIGIKCRETKKIYLEVFGYSKNCLKARVAKSILTKRINKNSTVYTDGHRSYRQLSKYFKSHQVIVKDRIVRRREKESGLNFCCWTESYVDGSTHVNGIEGVWRQFRTMMGTYNHFSRELSSGYLAEFVYRWNRKAEGAERGEMLEEIIARIF